MTERTRSGEGSGHMIRIFGGGVVFDVAAIAIGGRAQELIIDMASDAGQGGMRANQREAETRMIEPVHVDRQPDIGAVTLSAGDGESRGAMIDGFIGDIVGPVARLALRSKLPPMEIGMTRRALDRCLAKYEVGVTRTAFHCFVQPLERI